MAELFYERQLERLVHDMSDEVGLIQHSHGAIPNPLSHGYSIDDVARGLIVLSRVYPKFDDKGVADIYLDYIKNAQRSDGFFHNFCDSDGNFKEEDYDSLQDCYGRVMWSLAEFSDSFYPEKEREKARKIFLGHLDTTDKLKRNYNQSIALTLIGLSHYYLKNPNEEIKQKISELAEILAGNFYRHSDESWQWFDDKMIYCNSRLPHSMILAGKVLGDERALEIGKTSLDFLIQKTFRKHDGEIIFHAIGNRGWYKKGDEKPTEYDEQSVEAGEMAELCVDASRIISPVYKKYARIAFEWFKGANSRRVLMIDTISGGVYDGITKNGVNRNQGAECIVAYLMAATRMAELE